MLVSGVANPPPVGNPVVSRVDFDIESWDFNLVAELCLPISKSDFRGTGAKRRLRCNCASVGPERCAPPRLRKQRRNRIEELGGAPDNEDTCTEELLSAPMLSNGWARSRPRPR